MNPTINNEQEQQEGNDFQVPHPRQETSKLLTPHFIVPTFKSTNNSNTTVLWKRKNIYSKIFILFPVSEMT